jgi:hypothetical protein
MVHQQHRRILSTQTVIRSESSAHARKDEYGKKGEHDFLTNACSSIGVQMQFEFAMLGIALAADLFVVRGIWVCFKLALPLLLYPSEVTMRVCLRPHD